MRNTTGRIIANPGRDNEEVIGTIDCSPYNVYQLPNILRRYADEIEAAMIEEGFDMDPPVYRVSKKH